MRKKHHLRWSLSLFKALACWHTYRQRLPLKTSDLRIKVPKDASSKNIRPLSPLAQESLSILTQHLPSASEELRLQVLISIDTGMRIQEVATLSLSALDTATPLAESEHRYELSASPQLNGVQTKYGKARRIEISAELLSVLNEYRISERRLKRVAKLNSKLDNLFEVAITLKHEAIEALELCERHEPLFVSEQGNPVSGKSIEARWTELRTLIKKSIRHLPTVSMIYVQPTVHIALMTY